MADLSSIEWTDATWTIVQGCDPYSQGCVGCYAIPLLWRMAHNPDPKISVPLQGLTEKHVNRAGETILRFTGKLALREDRLSWPLNWKTPRMIFVPSHGDIFHKDVPDAFLDKIFDVMERADWHTFQVLTKRSRRMREYVNRRYADRDAPAHIWFMVSAEDQPNADERIPDLLATKAAVRGVSLEPLLGPIDLSGFLPRSIPGHRRSWDSFVWPAWVPKKVRAQIVSFHNPAWGRGPDSWMRGALDNGQPPLGTEGQYDLCRNDEALVSGRFIPAWNNIGRVVDGAGAVHVASAGIYQSRPAYLDWIIVGGESGKNARPMHPDWAYALRDQCAAAGKLDRFFFKQWGEYRPCTRAELNTACGAVLLGEREACGYYCDEGVGHVDHGGTYVLRVGKRKAGRLLDGVEHNGMPEARA